MENPATPQKTPYKIKVEKDKTYFWCFCGFDSAIFSKRHRSQKLFMRFSSEFPQVLNCYETTQSMIFIDFSRRIFEKMEAKNHLIR